MLGASERIAQNGLAFVEAASPVICIIGMFIMIRISLLRLTSIIMSL